MGFRRALMTKAEQKKKKVMNTIHKNHILGTKSKGNHGRFEGELFTNQKRLGYQEKVADQHLAEEPEMPLSAVANKPAGGCSGPPKKHNNAVR